MSKFLKIAVAAAAALSINAQAAVGDPLDDFSVVQTVSDNTRSTVYNSGVFATQNLLAEATIFGGYRDIYAQKTADGFAVNNATRDVNASASSGQFSFSEDTATVGFAVLRYDGAVSNGTATDLSNANPLLWVFGADTSTSLGSLNSFGTGFSFSYTSDFVFQITILVYTAGGNIAIAQQTTQATGFEADGVTPIFKQDAIFFSELIDLATGLPIDKAILDDTRAIEVVFNGNLAQASIDLAFTPPIGIPEPASIALAGLALLGIGAARARRKA